MSAVVAVPVFMSGVVGEEKGLLACLTEQILWGRLEVEEARQIVLRHLRCQQEALRRPRLVAGSFKLREVEAVAIREALDKNHWHRGRTATALGITRRGLAGKMGRLGLNVEKREDHK